jgi:hypothetical protein
VNKPKYHVALSFAGEDRDYVESVATHLRTDGVDVFYDKFEEADLWGKNLYVHLSDVYQNRAIFTVMFISKAYKTKLWPNRERESAQARALEESREYILPAFFDDSIVVPGLLRTTGRISLSSRTPEQLARLILQKLMKSGVQLKRRFVYNDDARADVDFPLRDGHVIAELIKAMKSYNWYTQNPAIDQVIKLKWANIAADEAFVIGRNLYQCACGGARKALHILANLRRELASIPEERAFDLLNGMFFEVYFNSEGEFRGPRLKGQCLETLLTLQTVKKFEPSIAFIRRALDPYRQEIPFRPNMIPETVIVDVAVLFGDPPTVRSLKVRGRSILTKDPEDADTLYYAWRLSRMSFTLEELGEILGREWSIPENQLSIKCSQLIDPKVKLRLPEGSSVSWPKTRL